MLKTILSISGKPGLYKLISQGKNMLIVESISADKKRFPAYGNEKIISLADIAMYTDDAEVPLYEVLEAIKEKKNLQPLLLIQRKQLLNNCVNIWLKYCRISIANVCMWLISRN